MHSIKVVSLAQYLTNGNVKWRDEDHCASMFVKAVKGLPFRGYGMVPVGNRRERLEQSNAHAALRWTAAMAPTALQTIGLKLLAGAPPCLIVPMPSSITTVANPRNRGRAHLLADEMAAAHPTLFQVLDILSFREPMQPSRQGGTRDPRALRDAMIVDGRGSKDVIGLIIVDDVLTTGGHFQAACCALEEAGWPVTCGFSAGRTASWPEEDPFAIQNVVLRDPFRDPFAALDEL